MHRSAQPSYLSAEAKAPNYRGLLNLGVVLLFISNFRLLLDTIQRHGFVLADVVVQFDKMIRVPGEHELWREFPFLYGMFLLAVFVVTSIGIEFLLGRKKIDETIGMILHQLNSHSSLFIPATIVWTSIESPLLGSTLMFVSLITCKDVVACFM